MIEHEPAIFINGAFSAIDLHPGQYKRDRPCRQQFAGTGVACGLPVPGTADRQNTSEPRRFRALRRNINRPTRPMTSFEASQIKQPAASPEKEPL